MQYVQSLTASCLIASLTFTPISATAQDTVAAAPASVSDGHIHIVSSSGGQMVGIQMAWAGVGFIGLGALTLFGELIVAMASVVSAFSCFGSTTPCSGSGLSGPPIELSWSAVGVISGGALIGLIGLIVALASPTAPRVSRPITRGIGEIRF